MVSTRWEKQNSSRFKIALLILFGSIFAIGYPAALFDLEGMQGVIASAIALIGGIVVAFFLLKWQAKSMVRVLKFEYKDIERGFRVLFKENHIQFNRKTMGDAFEYHFPGYQLTMVIHPYELLNLAVETPKDVILQTTKITLGELNATNETFAQNLADLIDEMDKNLLAEHAKPVHC